jgi:hypothetical protein
MTAASRVDFVGSGASDQFFIVRRGSPGERRCRLVRAPEQRRGSFLQAMRQSALRRGEVAEPCMSGRLAAREAALATSERPP